MARDLGKITQASTTPTTPSGTDLMRPEREPEKPIGIAQTPTNTTTAPPKRKTLKEVGKDVFNFFTGAPQAVGQDIVAALPDSVSGIDKVRETEMQNSNKDLEFIKNMNDKLRKGEKLTSTQQKLYDDIGAKLNQPSISEKFVAENLPARNKSNLQVAGDFAMLGADVLGAGTFGKGATAAMKTGSLAPKYATAPTAITAAQKATEVLPAASTRAAEQYAQTNAPKVANKLHDKALEITMPKLTEKEAGEAISKGQTTAPGLFKPSRVLPTNRDHIVAESVEHLIDPAADVSKNALTVNTEVARINQGVKEFVRDNKVPFNEKQLRTQLNGASDDLKLIFASDATAERTYKAVVDAFVDTVRKKDTAGLFEARQVFDQIPSIKKLLQSEGLGENVRREIVLNVRRAANDYVSALLPEGNPYKSLLRKESLMFEALTNMGMKNADKLGKTTIQALVAENPVLAAVLGSLGLGLGLGGVGVGTAIINSTDR